VPKLKTNSISKPIAALMTRKTAVLSKARVLTDMGMRESAQPLWETAASFEEQIAPLLETLGRAHEAAVHRISAASCYRQAGQFSRAANLFQAAIAGPLSDDSRSDVQRMLAECLTELTGVTIGSAT
jgi:hypothetical protein